MIVSLRENQIFPIIYIYISLYYFMNIGENIKEKDG